MADAFADIPFEHVRSEVLLKLNRYIEWIAGIAQYAAMRIVFLNYVVNAVQQGGKSFVLRRWVSRIGGIWNYVRVNTEPCAVAGIPSNEIIEENAVSAITHEIVNPLDHLMLIVEDVRASDVAVV